MAALKKILFVLVFALGLIFLTGCPEFEDIDDSDNNDNHGDEVKENEEVKEKEKELVFFDSELDYTETLDSFHNPERGFYRAMEADLPKDHSNPLWSEDLIRGFSEEFNLFHLRIGLEAFSSNAGGEDGLLSPRALKCLENTLDIFRKCDANVIIRFSYNRRGLSGSNGFLNNEPDLNLVLLHVSQLGDVLSKYYDVLASVETGMFGPWGEQHSTKLGNPSEENSESYFKLVEAWLNALPEGFGITVRRPLYYIYWANRKYNLALSSDNLGNFDFSDYPQYPDLKRVGVYNDGYLGSASDLGTYRNRASEVKWLMTQTEFTLFGGEVVADSETGGIGAFNNVSYLEEEAFLAHTSYLNYFWNYNAVISKWETNVYKGKNELYKNNTSEFVFVKNHLGYRFVLKESLLGSDGKKLYLKGKIENVGFGNMVNEKKAEIILENETDTLYLPVKFDVRKILSGSIHHYSFDADLPEGLSGEYRIYLKISDIHELTRSPLRSIRFANSSNYWRADLGANFLGKINL